MDLTSILNVILSLFNKDENNANSFGDVLSNLAKNKTNTQTQENNLPNPNDKMWQLPNFDFYEKSQKFLNQQDFEKEKTAINNTQQKPSFNPQTILEIAKIFQELFKKNEPKTEEQKSFISTLKRCDET